MFGIIWTIRQKFPLQIILEFKRCMLMQSFLAAVVLYSTNKEEKIFEFEITPQELSSIEKSGQSLFHGPHFYIGNGRYGAITTSEIIGTPAHTQEN